MVTIDEKLYNRMPSDIQELFKELPNFMRDEVVSGFPNSKSTGGSGKASQKTAPNDIYGKYKEGYKSANLGGLGDSGSASRFFYVAKSPKRERLINRFNCWVIVLPYCFTSLISVIY